MVVQIILLPISSLSQMSWVPFCKNTKLIAVRGFLKVKSCLTRIYFSGKPLCDTVGICDCQALQSRIKTWRSKRMDWRCHTIILQSLLERIAKLRWITPRRCCCKSRSAYLMESNEQRFSFKTKCSGLVSFSISSFRFFTLPAVGPGMHDFLLEISSFHLFPLHPALSTQSCYCFLVT